MWFQIKYYASCHYGAKHLFDLISRGSYLSEHLKKLFHSVIQRNAFYAHQENLIISMITDEKNEIRQLGLQKILKARSQQGHGSVNIQGSKSKLCSERISWTHHLGWRWTNIRATYDERYSYWAVIKSYPKSWDHRNGYHEASMPHTNCRTVYQACHRIIKHGFVGGLKEMDLSEQHSNQEKWWKSLKAIRISLPKYFQALSKWVVGWGKGGKSARERCDCVL